ncbi:MAG TPA: right-handed parallel beta-helix repeat-containing protein [Vicinamibacterales bacterium]|nr:right-handed parallel beta-helix repeat-containing protein [Vicinamibacterales bacterium]
MSRRTLVLFLVILAVGAAAIAEAATLRVCASGCAYTDLQRAIDAAAPGDAILLRAGETFAGHFILRRKSGHARIVIRSDAPDGELPGPGVRLVPSGRPGGNTPLSRLARLRGLGGSYRTTPVIRTESGAHHYTLQFLEIDGSMQEGYETLISLGTDSQTSLSQVPHQIILDRVYVHGHTYRGQKRCVALNSASTQIRNSYIIDCKSFTNDAQAIAGWNGPGPYVIENNYLEASGENIIFGGDDPKICELVPSDIVIRRNHLTKPLSWKSAILATPSGVQASASSTAGALPAGTHYFKVVAIMMTGGSPATSKASAEVSASLTTSGRSALVKWNPVAGATSYRVYRGTRAGGQNVYMSTPAGATSLVYTGSGERSGTPPAAASRWMVKNLLELKNAQRVTIEGNVIEHVWPHAQNGYAVLLTPRNQSNTAPWSVVRDVTLRHNIIRRANGGINILGYDYAAKSGSQRTRRITIAHNLAEEIGTSDWGGNGHFVIITQSPTDVRIDHNTILQSHMLVAIDDGQSSGFVFTNNLTRHNTYGIFGSGAGSGNAALAAYFPGAIVQRNVFAGGPSSLYPSGNWFPSLSALMSQFVAPASGDYRLVAGSPYRNAGTDGKDLGADFGALTAALSGATPPPSSGSGGEPLPTPPPPGTGGGAVVTPTEIVMTAADVRLARGHWSKAASPGSPGGQAMASTDTGWSATETPLEEPQHYFEAVFQPVANTPYRVWLRMRSPSLPSNSVWVQFTGAVDEKGQPLWRTGTTSALQVQQSPCANCPSTGWGWEDNGWWVNGPSIVRFPSSAPQTIRIQTREDGVMIDHIVLSPARYMSAAPGPQSHDTTVLTRSAQPLRPSEVVLRTEDVVRRNGNLALRTDETAAAGRVIRSEDRGWYAAQPLENPHNVVEFTFTAMAGVRYRVWFRMAAAGGSAQNDSVFAQFTRTVAANGSPIHRLGTTSAIIVNRQQCSGCAISGWGWTDGAWWIGQPAIVTFTTTGMQRMRVQLREDGVRLDQIVLSPVQYLNAAPGMAEDDNTVVPR